MIVFLDVPAWRALTRRHRVRLRLAARWGRRQARAGWRRFRSAAHPALRRGAARVGPALRQAGRSLWRVRPSPALGAALLLGGGAVAGGLYAGCGVSGCPDVGRLVSYQPGGSSVLLDRSGVRFADFAPMDYEVVELESLPPYLPAAFVAVEDQRFAEHDGVDWVRVGGAMVSNARKLRLAEGSSTLTMQLSRTLFADRIRREDRTLWRKLVEVRVAGEIEERFTKDEILELYLNHIYLGGTLHGVQAASRALFGRDAAEVSLHQAALLAALPRAPAHYDPRSRPDAARERRNLVLSLMEAQGLIAPDEAARARERPLDVRTGDDVGHERTTAPYFVQQVRDLLEAELGDRIYTEALKIHTTLDLRAQRAAENALGRQLRELDRGSYGRLRLAAPDQVGTASREVQGAVVFMQPTTGEILAWVGGRDFRSAPFDRVRLTRRQAGSVFKPFVYAAALEEGRVASQPVLDEPYRPGGDDDEWEPRNYSGRFEGRMSLREALVRSQNVPAVRLAHDLGSRRVADFVERAGFSEAAPRSPVAALGVTAVSPLEVARAYSAFAAGGQRAEPRLVNRVEDGEGRVLWSSEPEREPVTSPQVAFVVTDILRQAVDRGTGSGVRSVGYAGPAAGKTGTTDGATDVWFAGYTPELVGAVWIGFDGPGALPVRASGGSLAAPVWGRIAAALHDPRNAPSWDAPPAGVTWAEVDPATGMVLRDGCRPRFDAAQGEFFLPGTEPGTVCPRRGGRGFLGSLERWLDGLLSEEEPLPGEPDPELGVPILRPGDPARGDRSRWRISE